MDINYIFSEDPKIRKLIKSNIKNQYPNYSIYKSPEFSQLSNEKKWYFIYVNHYEQLDHTDIWGKLIDWMEFEANYVSYLNGPLANNPGNFQNFSSFDQDSEKIIAIAIEYEQKTTL